MQVLLHITTSFLGRSALVGSELGCAWEHSCRAILFSRCTHLHTFLQPFFSLFFCCLVCHTALSLLLQKQGSVALTWLGGNVERGLNKHNQLTAETVMIAMVWGLIVWDFYIVDSYYPVNVTPKFWHVELPTSLTKSQRGYSMNANGQVVSQLWL